MRLIRVWSLSVLEILALTALLTTPSWSSALPGRPVPPKGSKDFRAWFLECMALNDNYQPACANAVRDARGMGPQGPGINYTGPSGNGPRPSPPPNQPPPPPDPRIAEVNRILAEWRRAQAGGRGPSYTGNGGTFWGPPTRQNPLLTGNIYQSQASNMTALPSFPSPTTKATPPTYMTTLPASPAAKPTPMPVVLANCSPGPDGQPMGSNCHL